MKITFFGINQLVPELAYERESHERDAPYAKIIETDLQEYGDEYKVDSCMSRQQSCISSPLSDYI
jgi:hypothetical protein